MIADRQAAQRAAPDPSAEKPTSLRQRPLGVPWPRTSKGLGHGGSGALIAPAVRAMLDSAPIPGARGLTGGPRQPPRIHVRNGLRQCRYPDQGCSTPSPPSWW